ncbi:MAG TPA: PA14 domain-containing protein [Vicinamibacterales bacterium]
MQRVVTIAVWILVAVAGAAAGGFALPPAGLRGHYYTNLTRSGPPVAIVIDQSITTDTLDNGTAGVWPAFSVEWTGAIYIDKPGAYRFATVSDDGSQLEVSDRLVVDNGGRHGPQEAVGQITLAAGIHPFRVRYEQAGGGFVLELKFAREDAPLVTIPSSVLMPEPMSYAAYRLRRAAPIAGATLALLLWSALRLRLKRTPAAARLWLPQLDRPGVAIAIVAVVAVAVRIFMMLGSNAILWGDSDVFIEGFGHIRSGRFLEHDPFRTLLYPYFLTAFLIWSGEPPMDQVIVGAQHGLGVIAAVAFFLAGRVAFGSRIALAGALLFAVHTTQLFYENSILSEAFFVCVLALSLLVLIALVREPSVPRALAAGAACVALTMTRPVAEFFVVIPIAVAMLACSRWIDRVKVAAAVLVVYAAVLLPWAALNERQFGFFGVAVGRGLGLFIRTFEIEKFDPPPDTKYPEIRDILLGARGTQYSPATFVRDELSRRKYSAAQADDLMYRSSVEAARARPVDFAVGTVRQWWRQLGSLQDEQVCDSVDGEYICSKRTIGYAREPFLNRPRRANEPVRPWVVAYFRHFRIPMHAVSVLAALGVIACLANEGRAMLPGILISLTAIYFTLLPAIGQSPQDRYRLPADALLFMLAAFGLSVAVGRLISSAGAPGATRRSLESRP